jgi:hypothetical protein
MKNSVPSGVHTLKDTWVVGARGCVEAAGETETSQGNIQDWIQLGGGDRRKLLR